MAAEATCHESAVGHEHVAGHEAYVVTGEPQDRGGDLRAARSCRSGARPDSVRGARVTACWSASTTGFYELCVERHQSILMIACLPVLLAEEVGAVVGAEEKARRWRSARRWLMP